MKLIDKDKIVAEIEKRIKEHHSGYLVCLKDILSFLETLEVKEVNEEPVNNDLEEASKKWLRPQLDKSYANYGEVKMMELTHFDGYSMLDAIEFGAEWQKEQMIDKAFKYINYQLNLPSDFEQHFRKAMEE